MLCFLWQKNPTKNQKKTPVQDNTVLGIVLSPEPVESYWNKAVWTQPVAQWGPTLQIAANWQDIEVVTVSSAHPVSQIETGQPESATFCFLSR